MSREDGQSMKRYITFLLSVASVLALMPPTARAASLCSSIVGNLVQNCGFDGGATVPGGNVPADWNASQFTSEEAIVGSPVNGSDSDSLRIANDEFQGGPLVNGAAIMWQDFTDTPGEEYTFDFYVYNGAPDAAGEQFQAFWEPTACTGADSVVLTSYNKTTPSPLPARVNLPGRINSDKHRLARPGVALAAKAMALRPWDSKSDNLEYL
jgi:hypothetical protein